MVDKDIEKIGAKCLAKVRNIVGGAASESQSGFEQPLVPSKRARRSGAGSEVSSSK